MAIMPAAVKIPKSFLAPSQITQNTLVINTALPALSGLPLLIPVPLILFQIILVVLPCKVVMKLNSTSRTSLVLPSPKNQTFRFGVVACILMATSKPPLVRKPQVAVSLLIQVLPKKSLALGMNIT